MFAVGSGHLSYQWKKDKREITGPKYSGTNGPILTINKFSTDDQGEYMCVVKDSRKIISSNSANMALSKCFVSNKHTCILLN